MSVIDPLMQDAIAEAGIVITAYTWLQGDPTVFHNTLQSRDDINHRFDYHRPDTDQVSSHESVRDRCKDLAHHLDVMLPPGREKALALTKLEEALMWANAAIARA